MACKILATSFAFLIIFCMYDVTRGYNLFHILHHQHDNVTELGGVSIETKDKVDEKRHEFQDDGSGPKVFVNEAVKLFGHVMECQFTHPHAISLTFSSIECFTRQKCTSKLSCAFNGTNCGPQDKVPSESHLYRKGQSGSIELDFEADVGLVLCVAELEDDDGGHEVRATMEYFYMGVDYKHYLTSDKLDRLPGLIEIRVDRFAPDDYLNWHWNHVAYTNEEVKITCSVVTFFHVGSTLTLTVHKKDGTTFKFDLKMMGGASGDGLKWSSTIKFRIPKNISSLSCSAQERNSDLIIQDVINLTTIDPPLNPTINLPNSTKLTTRGDEHLACNLSHDIHLVMTKAILDLQFFGWTIEDGIFTNPIDFLRFQEMSGGNYSCINLHNLTSHDRNTSLHFDYEFNLAHVTLKKPKIDKSQGHVITLQGDQHRTLSCSYSGEPKPYVIWFQDGEEILYDIGKEAEGAEGDPSEISMLQLPTKNSKLSPHKTNFTCTAYNSLGEDSLYFIIERVDPIGPTDEAGGHVMGPSSDLWLILWSVTSACLVLSLLVGIMYRQKYLRNERLLQKLRDKREGTLELKPKEKEKRESLASESPIVRYTSIKSKYKILLDDS